MSFVLNAFIWLVSLFHIMAAHGDVIKSDQGHWEIAFEKPIDKIGLHKITDVDFSLLPTDKTPVSDLKLRVEGGMPGHGHGFPTTPYIEEQSAGLYTLKGVSFSMRGEWLLVIKVESDSQGSDQFTLPLYIRP
ncbi:FixH family protein [Endozoicomonas arenosclerae]|uniref:FixH family protein n=1 Tax=Endozoicomonas arenosclerae TaxID=1633495 RepID=UPI0007858394|nr:FixH family protein [Endozoicomonas arenosclerae]